MGKSVLIYHVEWFVRILIAAICGCCIGYERSSRNKGAGIRTHAILALGSALMELISKYGFCDFKNIDGSRLAAQIVSGVGFLGAGVIFVRHGTVSGLTTAAGMWATSGVGMCIGCGLYDLGIISTFLIVGLQTLFHRGFFLRMTQNTIKVRLEVLYRKNLIYDIENLFSNNNLNIIYGKNESGKSTILNFIFNILYGIQKNKNGKEISDYEKYKPWDSDEFSGKITYELDNKNKYEIYREFNKKNPNIFNEQGEEISNKFIKISRKF